MLGATAMEVLRPWPLKVIFDGILIPDGNQDRIIAWLSAYLADPESLLAVAAGAILVIAVVGAMFSFGQVFLIACVGQKVVASVRQQLYAHIQRLSHSFHDERNLGDLLARLTGDAVLMRDLLVNSVIYLSARFLVIVGIIGIMLMMDWRLTLVALLVTPLLAVSVVGFGRKIKGAARRQRRKESQIADVMTERLVAIRVVQAYAREAHEEAVFARNNMGSAKAGLRATRLEAHLNRLVQVVLAVGTAAVIGYGVLRVGAGALTPGDLLVFAAYLTSLYKPVRKLAAMTGRISKATVCGERITAILDVEPEIRDAPDARPAPPFAGTVEFRDVDFAYGNGSTVLRNVNLTLQAGQTVALMGESGAGKSTIANLLLRFYDPQRGTVRIDGHDVHGLTLSSLREQIAIVLQESVLFDATVRDNIAYGKLEASEEEIVAAATAAHAHDFIRWLPNGYDTVIGERGAMLSAGQRQRIAVARALIRDAAIVVLDEPLTGLDRGSEDAVIDALSTLMQGRTCLLITHDRRTAALADRILLVENGAVSEMRDSHLPASDRAVHKVG